jgi:hypothetical protein
MLRPCNLHEFFLRGTIHKPRHSFGKQMKACYILASLKLRVTSHMRLRARDHYTSSTLIGGKGRAGPSSLHTMLEGPMGYVNASWT